MKEYSRDIFDSHLAKVLLNKRKEKGWSIHQFADISQLPTTVINGAERGISAPTILTVVTLFHFLEIDIHGFLFNLDIPWLSQGSYGVESLSKDTLGIQDIELFLEYYENRRTLGIEELARHYQRILALTESDVSGAADIFQKSKDWVANSLNPSVAITDESSEASVETLVAYPRNIDPDEIYYSLSKCGVLLFPDCGFYLEHYRKTRKLSKLAIEKKTSISHTTENRIEMGRVSRIRFADIISLDATLNALGRISAMFWRAALFHTGLIRNRYYGVPRESKVLSWTTAEWPIVQTIVRIDRLMRSVVTDGESWVSEFRQTLDNWKQSHPSPAGDAGLPQHILWRLDPRDHLAEIIFRRLKTNRLDLMRPATFIDNYDMRPEIEVWNQFANLYCNNPVALRIMEKGARYSATPEEEDAFRKLIDEVLADPLRRRNLEKMLI